MLQKTETTNGDNGRQQAAEEAARQASLIYVGDTEPGIRRRKAGSGFSFVGANGKPVTNRKTLARIRSLVIPPAWTDVWICAAPDGHIQATGRDQRGRKQYRYHPRWSEIRDEVKYSGVIDFARALPRIREKIDADLRRRELPRERVVASIVWLLDNTMIRVGNAVYARDNKSFGLTTLKTRHVEVEGAKLRFAFKGKSGKEWKLKLVDRRMAKTIRSIQELPGQNLFQYMNGGGERRSVTSQDVNDYIRDAAGRQDRSCPRHEHRDRRGCAASRQHTHGLPAVLHPPRGDGVLVEGPSRPGIGRRQEIAPETRGPGRRGSACAALAGVAQDVTAPLG